MSANGASWAVSLEAPEYIPLVLCSCVLSSVWSRGAQNFHSRGKGALYALWGVCGRSLMWVYGAVGHAR
eukprot:1187925-Prorocentrum_minimum.AAC.1